MTKLTKKVADLVDEGRINLTCARALAHLPLDEQEQFIDEALVASNFIAKIDALVDKKIVLCDMECGAFENPETLNECKASLEHFKHHTFRDSCSHGWYVK